MIEDITDGIDATSAGTGVPALGVDAGQAGGAICVEDALWSAGQVRVSEKSWQTFTGCSSA